MPDFAVTIHGNSLGALLTAALATARGMEVCLVLAGHEGFDDSFQMRDVFLEGGLILTDGANPDGPVAPTLHELNIALGFRPLERPTSFATDAGAIRLGPTYAALAASLGERFPNDRGKLERLATSMQDWFDRWEAGAHDRGFADPNPRAWQHETIAELSLTGTYRVSSQLFPTRRLAQLARTSFAAVLEELDLDPAHRIWWDTLLVQRTGHLPLTLDCLTVAQTLGRESRGLAAIAGGLDPFRQQLLNRIRQSSGCRVVEGNVEAITFRAGQPVTTQVEDAGVWSSHQVICDRASLMWTATETVDSVSLKALPGAQRYPHVVGALVAMSVPSGFAPPSGQTWWVPRTDLPPTGSNGFWITHLPAGSSLPNPPGLHLAAIHGAYLESQLLDPHGRLYPEDDLIRRLWQAAQQRDPHLQWPLEAFLGVLPRRVAPLKGLQTLLPDPRKPVAKFMQEGRLGGVPQCWWLDRAQHPLTDLRSEFVLARLAVAQLLSPTPIERVFGEVRHIFAPMQVSTAPMLPVAEIAPRRSVTSLQPELIVFGESAAEIGLAVAADEAEELIESLGDPLPIEEEENDIQSAVDAPIDAAPDTHTEAEPIDNDPDEDGNGRPA